MAYKSGEEIIKMALSWESKLSDYYEVAAYAVKNEKSREILRLLKNSLAERMEIIRRLGPECFERIEWIKNLPDQDGGMKIFLEGITRSSMPEDIFNHLLKFEERLRDFYKEIMENLKEGPGREFYENLYKFKIQRIIEIKKIIYDYGII